MSEGPYREVVPIDFVETDGPAPPLAVIDVQGTRGANAVPGARGFDGGSSGARGGNGAHAGPAQAGGHAGTIRVDLAEADGVVTVKGKANDREVRETLVAVEQGYVELRARGGDGGTGGTGGRGGDGARGHTGRDATRFSHGTDGGSGGDGGDGGNGSSGERGGDGGSVVIAVRDEDTPLLMLLAHNIDGGTGGAVGTHGGPGAGGSGGSGGVSYSWTTSSSYRDSSGNTRTRTNYHRNPGGNNGSYGNTGRAGVGRIVAGESGTDGTFAIQVTTAKGVESYPARYDLRLTGFEHDSMNQDAVYEPNELVRVFQLDVANVGGMPTPAHDELSLSLIAGGWVRPEPGELQCPRSLADGAVVRIAGELKFRIKDWDPTESSDPLEVEESILQRAMLPSVGRSFEHYQAQSLEAGRFVIRFPVRASAPANLRSLGTGEATRVKFGVTNQSRFALGADSDSKRVVRVRVTTLPDSELGDEHIAFSDAVPSEGWVREIPRLEAGEAVDFEFTLTVKAGAPEYRRYAARVSLELGRLEAPASARPVQLRDLDVRVARPFTGTEADLLLVVNHRTTREELDAWEALAEKMAFRLAVWDLTREGHFDLDAASAHSSLLELLAGKSIVVLDNEIDGPDGPMYPHAFVSSEQATRAADAGIDIAFVGKGPNMRSFMVPAGAGTLALAKRDALDVGELVEAAATEKRSSLAMHRRYWLRWWAKPDETWLEKQAHSVSEQLAGAHPMARHVVVHRFAPEVVSRFLWIKKWRVGHVETVRTLDAARGSVLTLATPDARVHDPAFVASPEAVTALLITFDAAEKLERLRRLATTPDVETAELDRVVDLLLLDVANEIASACAPGWKRGAGRDDLVAALPTVAALAKSDLTASYDSIGGGALLRLAGRARFLAESQVSMWEKLGPWRWSRRAPAVVGIVEDATEEMLHRAFAGVDPDSIDRDVTQIARDSATEAKLASRRELCSPEAWTMSQFRAPLAQLAITSDTELIATPAERVLTGAEYDELSQAAAVTAAMREKLVASAAAAQRDLKA